MIQILLFVLGVHLCTQMIAACYGIIDLWSCIDQWFGTILARLLFWGGVILILELVLGEGYLTAFNSGLIFFVVFHIVIFWIGQLIRALVRARAD